MSSLHSRPSWANSSEIQDPYRASPHYPSSDPYAAVRLETYRKPEPDSCVEAARWQDDYHWSINDLARFTVLAELVSAYVGSAAGVVVDATIAEGAGWLLFGPAVLVPLILIPGAAAVDHYIIAPAKIKSYREQCELDKKSLGR